MSSSVLDEALKLQLSARLFASADESVLAALRVAKDEVAPGVAAAATTLLPAQQRVLIITVKKSGKTRLYKAKQMSNGNFSIGKTWLLDDIRVIEIVNKASYWTPIDPAFRDGFLIEMLKLCRKRPPRLINFSDRLLRDSRGEVIVTVNTDEKEIDDQLEVSEAGVDIVHPEKVKRKQYAENELINTDELLKIFDWKVMHDASALEGKLQKELAALESTNLHAMLETSKSTSLVVAQIERTLSKLDEIDGWLALYTNQLTEMAREAATIESKNTALHIQTENQEKLQHELESILASMTLPESVIHMLQHEALDSVSGVRRVEEAANTLRRAVTSTAGEGANRLRFVQERMAELQFHCTAFAKRFFDFISQMLLYQAEMTLSDKSRQSKKGNLKLVGRENMQEFFAKYRSMFAWLKEVDPQRHIALQKQYAQAVNKIIRKEVKEFFEILRTQHLAKPPVGDELDYLFTVQTTMPSGLARNAGGGSKQLLQLPGAGSGIKSTFSNSSAYLSRGVHTRNDAISRLGDNDISDSVMALEIVGTEKMNVHDAFASALEIMIPMVVREQNYLTELFSLLSDAPSSSTINENGEVQSWERCLDTPQTTRAPAEIETKIRETVDEMLDPLPAELSVLVEIGLRGDSTISIGLLATTEKQSEIIMGSNLSYIKYLFESLDKRLITAWEKLLNEQSRAIQESNTTAKKRTGVLTTVRVLVKFVAHIENLVLEAKGRCRAMVDQGYQRLVSLVFESLESIAHDVSQNADDKEQINIHIVIIENMSFFRTELRTLNTSSLDENLVFAETSYEFHLSSYIKKVIKKPLSKLIEFFDGIDNLLRTGTPEEVGFHMNYNKAAAKKIVAQYPLKEIRKAIEVVHKRVEKHLSDETHLIEPVWQRIASELVATRQWMAKLLGLCYRDAGLQLEFEDKDIMAICGDLMDK